MGFQFKKAERKQVKLRIGLLGPSGAGKTYSALILAKGLGGKTALIDTEHRRSEYYANEFEFDVLQLEPPFTPERYIEAIEAAENLGYDNLIIDSISHEWMGKGGILDIKVSMPGTNDFIKWSSLTPRHDAFIDKILRCNLHVITTMRGKDQYVLTENEKGKQAPKKVGVGGQQREGFEYECTVSFLIDQESHVATQTKDNTHLFENVFEKLTVQSGEKLKAWAEEGLEVKPLATKKEIDEVLQKAKAKEISNEDLKPIMLKEINQVTFKEITKENLSKLSLALDAYKKETK